jgi:hypothetical protein
VIPGRVSRERRDVYIKTPILTRKPFKCQMPRAVGLFALATFVLCRDAREGDLE